MFRRRDNRQWDQLRPVKFTRHFTKNADGSVLVELGDTRVFTTAKVEERVPAFLIGKGEGWVTAEYSLLPGSTLIRSQREVTRGQPTGRTSEIQRLIGRCLRAIIDRRALGERTITVDCDVLQADGGTRVASICGGFLALYDALLKLRKSGLWDELPLNEHLAAVSICQLNGQLLLDPNYTEDSQAEMDSNVVLTESGKILEIQVTSETKPFDEAKMSDLLNLAKKGVGEIIACQYTAFKGSVMKNDAVVYDDPVQAAFRDLTVGKLIASCIRVYDRTLKQEGLLLSLRVFPIIFVIIKAVWSFSRYHRLEYQRLTEDSVAGRDLEEAVLTNVEYQSYRKLGYWLCKSLHDLGPTFIKIGQMLSTRADLLPLPAMLELAALQEEVKPFPFAIAKQTIERELNSTPENLYASFDQVPIAAASLCQAYRAILQDGREVVVKVQRPDLVCIIRRDVQILSAVADEIMRYPGLCRHTDWPGVVQEFSRTINEEIDYIAEGRNADKFRNNFRSLSSICIPRIIWQLTGRRVLTIEYIAGTRVTDLTALKDQNIDPSVITTYGANFYLKQLLEDGFFHADPHPGNLRIMADGRVGIFDFGMVGHISNELKQHMVSAFLHVVQKEYRLLIDDFVNMRFLDPSVDRHSLHADLAPLIENRFAQGMSKVRFRKIIFDFSQICWRYPFRLPTEFTYVMRALLTLEGVALMINPDFNFIDVSLPFAQRMLVKNGVIGRALWRQIFINGCFSAESAIKLLKVAVGSS